MIVAEVGLSGTGGHDQRVVGGAVGVAQQDRVDGLVLQVDVGDLAEQHLAILLVLQHHASGWRDLAFGDDAGRHLVQQRLEQVVGGLGDHLDVDVGTLQLLGRVEAAEAGSDDDDLVLFRWGGTGVGHFRSSTTCIGQPLR